MVTFHKKMFAFVKPVRFMRIYNPFQIFFQEILKDTIVLLQFFQY